MTFSILSPPQPRFMDEGRVVSWNCAESDGGSLRCSIAEKPRRIVWRGGVGRVLRRSRRESPIRRVRGLWIVEELDSF